MSIMTKKTNWIEIEKKIAPNKWQRIEEGIYLIGRKYHVLYSNKFGKQIREKTNIKYESIKKTNIGDARDLLQFRRGQVASGNFHGIKAERVTFDELAGDIIRDYEDNNQQVWRLKISLNHLSGFFRGMKAKLITNDVVKNHYIPYRKKQDPYVANSTLNSEISALIRMFSLALEADPPKLKQAPRIKKLSTKGNQRTGFFEIDDYMKMKNALSEYLVPSFMLAYKSGMRREEIYSILIEQYNAFEKQLILKPLDTKTKEPRILKLDPEMDEVIRKQIEIRNNKYSDCPYIFYNEKGGRIKDFRESWDNALIKAGYELKFICKACKTVIKLNHNPNRKKKLICKCGCTELKRDNKLFHDLRRTGVRNLVRSGVPEKVAMQISGHKTRTVFENYNITSEQDLNDAVEKSYEYQKKKEAEYLKSIEPQVPEPTPSEEKEDSQEQVPTDKVVSLQTYRKNKVS
jgi:integrase